MIDHRTPLPPDRPASAVRRALLVQIWWTQIEVMVQLDIDEATLARWRRRRQVLAVWHAPANQYYYPPFQFAGRVLRREMSPLSGYLNEGVSESGWGEIEWLYAPHALLDGREPARVFPEDPERVLRVLHGEFLEDADNRW